MATSVKKIGPYSCHLQDDGSYVVFKNGQKVGTAKRSYSVWRFVRLSDDGTGVFAGIHRQLLAGAAARL